MIVYSKLSLAFSMFLFCFDEKQSMILCQGQKQSLKGYKLLPFKKFEGGPVNIFVERYQYNFQFHTLIFPITSILSQNMQTTYEQHQLHCRTYDILYFLHCIIMGLWVKPHATGQKYFIMAIINALHVCQIIKIDTFLFPIWDRPNKCKKLLKYPVTYYKLFYHYDMHSKPFVESLCKQVL